MAAADFHLKIKDLEGESKQKGYENQLQLSSWSWGAQNAGSMGVGTGGGTGKVSMQDFHFNITMGKHTPLAMKYCASGKHFDEGVLTCRRAGDTPQKYLVVTFNELVISSYQTSGHGDGLPEDSIAFNYTKIKMEYYAQDEKGKAGSAITGAFDVKSGEAK